MSAPDHEEHPDAHDGPHSGLTPFYERALRRIRALHVAFGLVVSGFTFAWLWLHDGHKWPSALVTALAWAAPGAVFTAAALSIGHRLSTAPKLVAAWVTTTLAWWATIATLNVALVGRRAALPDVFALAYIAFVVSAFFPLLASVRHRAEAQRVRVAAIEATVAMREAQLHALRWQIHPHFLFNALNTIAARIEEDPASAQSMVSDLSLLLRDTLDSPSVATVGDELRRVELYLRLQQARFEEGLRVEREIDADALAVALPPLLLQPIVENAVVHGMRHAVPATVRIAVRVEDDVLEVTVSNTGTLAREPSRTGVGLRNVRERLALFAGERQSFSLREEHGWVHATIKLRAARPAAP